MHRVDGYTDRFVQILLVLLQQLTNVFILCDTVDFEEVESGQIFPCNYAIAQRRANTSKWAKVGNIFCPLSALCHIAACNIEQV